MNHFAWTCCTPAEGLLHAYCRPTVLDLTPFGTYFGSPKSLRRIWFIAWLCEYTVGWFDAWLCEYIYWYFSLYCGVTLTHANYWIISVDSSTNSCQSQFNHFEDAEPLFRHMVPLSPVHAQSRANFIKLAFQHPKFCTEARDSVLKPAHTIGSCRSSPEATSQRLPWFSRPAIAA